MSAKELLEDYNKSFKEKVGIPGVSMNAPFAANKKAEIGLELEIEGIRLPTPGMLEKIKAERSGSTWTSKPDGSLRGESAEYVLTIPCFADEVELLVLQLWDLFGQMKTSLRLSNRCSTHVHVNVNGYRVNNLTSILALWATFEDILINWCGEQRKTNHFCLSSKDTASLLETWNMSLRTGNFRRNFTENFKYLALNILPIWQFGSVEFRVMSASENPRPIIDWALFVNALVRFAAEAYINPQDLASDLSERGGQAIFYDIADRAKVSDTFIRSVLDHPDNQEFQHSVLTGFRRAQPIVMGYPWHEWLPLIDKEYIPTPFAVNTDETEGIVRAPRNPVRRARPRDAFDFDWGFDEDRPQNARPGELRRPLNHRGRWPEYVIDMEMPIEFLDGTPAEIIGDIRPFATTFSARAVNPFRNANGRDLNTVYSYETNTGHWSGDPDVAIIRNVGAIPVWAPEDFIHEENFEDEGEPIDGNEAPVPEAGDAAHFRQLLNEQIARAADGGAGPAQRINDIDFLGGPVMQWNAAELIDHMVEGPRLRVRPLAGNPEGEDNV